MNSRLYFMAAVVFKITASITFTLLDKDQSLTLICTTVDFDDTIVFKLGTDSKGGCIAGYCSSEVPGYEKPTQDANITKMVITSCNETSDIGSWTCTYGGSTSSPVVVTTCSTGTNTMNKTNTSTDKYGKALAILSVCLLVADFIVVAVRFCAGSTGNTSGNYCLRLCQFIKKKFFDCCGCKSSQESEDGPGFFKDKVCTLISLLGFTYLVLYGVIVEVIVLIVVYFRIEKFQEVLVIGVGFGIVLVFSGLCLLVVVWMLMKFVNNGESRSPWGKKNATVDKRQQPDGDEGSQSTPKDPDAKHHTTGRPLSPKPDIASPQTGPVDSVNSPKRIVENTNILPSIDTLDEQKMDKKPKGKKKKKKKKEDEGQDNPAYVLDNNVLT